MSAASVAPAAGGVTQVVGSVVANDPVGAYRHLVISAPGVAELASPGQFVALAVGGPTSANLLRRCFSLHRVDVGLGTIEVVIAAHGPGTTWLT
ncbi:MAG TPA: dihydroorotate dehydrogenase electron transfer subunit, partial [Ornithinibacter sp.]|nr:dihydroorotate dehydrogenase electron transfer subunit [Ornithinibacter sp.]